MLRDLLSDRQGLDQACTLLGEANHRGFFGGSDARGNALLQHGQKHEQERERLIEGLGVVDAGLEVVEELETLLLNELERRTRDPDVEALTCDPSAAARAARGRALTEALQACLAPSPPHSSADSDAVANSNAVADTNALRIWTLLCGANADVGGHHFVASADASGRAKANASGKVPSPIGSHLGFYHESVDEELKLLIGKSEDHFAQFVVRSVHAARGLLRRSGPGYERVLSSLEGVRDGAEFERKISWHLLVAFTQLSWIQLIVETETWTSWRLHAFSSGLVEESYRIGIELALAFLTAVAHEQAKGQGDRYFDVNRGGGPNSREGLQSADGKQSHGLGLPLDLDPQELAAQLSLVSYVCDYDGKRAHQMERLSDRFENEAKAQFARLAAAGEPAVDSLFACELETLVASINETYAGFLLADTPSLHPRSFSDNDVSPSVMRSPWVNILHSLIMRYSHTGKLGFLREQKIARTEKLLATLASGLQASALSAYTQIVSLRKVSRGATSAHALVRLQLDIQAALRSLGGSHDGAVVTEFQNTLSNCATETEKRLNMLL